MQTFDIIAPLKKLEQTAQGRPGSGPRTPFIDGYLMGIRHAIELVEIQQVRIDLRLAFERGEV